MIDHPLIQPTLYFLVGLAVASLVGASIYFLLRFLFWDGSEACTAMGGLFLLTVFVASTSLLDLPLSLAVLFGAASVWSVATWAERAVYVQHQSRFETFLRCALTTGVSFIVCVVVFLLVPLKSLDRFPGLLVGYPIGALFSPSLTPIFLWIWKTIQPRPGVDQHFYQGEDLP